MKPPAIILVRPQMGENIGATARAMMNFGLRDLRIVQPRDGWPNPKAQAMAAKGVPIIKNATIHNTLDSALSDCDYVGATTARSRDNNLPIHTPDTAIFSLRHHEHTQTALIFGPENSGLSTQDLLWCHYLITIPTDDANPSLNLGQAVMILAYEWMKQAPEQHKLSTNKTNDKATVRDISALASAWSTSRSNDIGDRFHNRMVALLTKAQLSPSDIAFLHSALSKTDK